ncbi:MAG: STAS domain-containing protein [Betaproteobacteria bacterium]|nr:STAS domain-containing protein [Betaproteobacteria bacterium]
MQASPEQRFATAVAVMVTSALVLGGCWALMGRFRLGSLVRFVPYPVICGFLAGVGWLMLQGGLGVAAGQRVGIDALLAPPSGLFWGPLIASVAVALVLMLLSLRWRHALMLPLALGASMCAVLAGLSLAGYDADAARAGGWLMLRHDSLRPLSAWDPALWQAVDAAALAAQAGAIVTVVIVGTIAMLLAHASLEVAHATEGDLDHDLRTLGSGNLLVGLAGGLLGGISLARSLANQQAGARSRWSNVVVGVASVVMAFVGAPLIAWLPLPVLGGLLIYLGLGVLKTWVYDTAGRMEAGDRAVILAMLALTMLFGYVPAVLAGMVISCLDFALSQSRLGPVRRVLRARDWPTPVERDPTERAWLDACAAEMRIVELQGSLFFGSVHAMVRHLEEWSRSRRPDAVLLDFRHVQHIDSSAMQALLRLRAMAQREGVLLWCSGIAPRVRPAFAEPDAAGGAQWPTHEDISAAVLAWEDRCLTARPGLPQDVLQDWLTREMGDAGAAIRLAAHLERVDLAPGQRLFSQGDAADSMCFISSGRLVVRVQPEPGFGTEPSEVKVLQAGTTVGEMGLYRHLGRTASVEALAPTLAWRLSRERLAMLELQEPAVAIALHRLIVRLLASRLDHANAQARAIAAGDPGPGPA